MIGKQKVIIIIEGLVFTRHCIHLITAKERNLKGFGEGKEVRGRGRGKEGQREGERTVSLPVLFEVIYFRIVVLLSVQ